MGGLRGLRSLSRGVGMGGGNEGGRDEDGMGNWSLVELE